jgi:hypothetical protein
MKIILIISLILFAVGCCLPALEFKTSSGVNDVMWGLRALAIGWSGLFAGVMAWYANPFWLTGIVLGFARKPLLAALAGVIAIAIALTTFSLVGRELPGDESNVTRMTVIRLLPGCYVWLSSLATLILSALFHGAK